MEKEFIPYDRALKLKALGFVERVLTYYENGVPKLYHDVTGWDFNNSFTTCVSRPTFSQCFRWFREKYGLHGEPIWDNDEKTHWFFSITKIGNVDFVEGRHRYETPLTEDQDFNDGYPVVLKWRKSYEEAELACLDKLIEIVEQK